MVMHIGRVCHICVLVPSATPRHCGKHECANYQKSRMQSFAQEAEAQGEQCSMLTEKRRVGRLVLQHKIHHSQVVEEIHQTRLLFHLDSTSTHDEIRRTNTNVH